MRIPGAQTVNVFPDDPREVWEKENRDPKTLEFPPRRRRTQIDKALHEATKSIYTRKNPRGSINWMDELDKLLGN